MTVNNKLVKCGNAEATEMSLSCLLGQLKKLFGKVTCHLCVVLTVRDDCFFYHLFFFSPFQFQKNNYINKKNNKRILYTH